MVNMLFKDEIDVAAFMVRPVENYPNLEPALGTYSYDISTEAR